jgi:hypothetical protein
MLTLKDNSNHTQPEYSTLRDGLKEILSALLRNDQTVGQIHSLVHRCQALAMQHLKAKQGAFTIAVCDHGFGKGGGYHWRKFQIRTSRL